MINRKYLPSKNFLIALSITIGIILIAIIINYFETNTSKYTNNDLVASSATTSAAVAIDSDHDGLPDWLEKLYGTDPNKADTDGDGTNDLQEIQANRDPLKPNTAPAGQEPNDKIDPQIIADQQKAIDEYQKLTPTEQMARNLMSSIIASQPANGQMDQATIDALVNKSLTSLPEKNFAGITKESDLNLISVDPKTLSANLLAYAKSYAIQTEILRKIMGQDLQIINDGLILKKTPDKQKLAVITNEYQDIIDNLIKMPLPGISGSSGVIYHLQIINSLEKMIEIDNDIIKMGNDVASGFSDLTEYSKTLNSLIAALSTIDTALGITRQ